MGQKKVGAYNFNGYDILQTGYEEPSGPPAVPITLVGAIKKGKADGDVIITFDEVAAGDVMFGFGGVMDSVPTGWTEQDSRGGGNLRLATKVAGAGESLSHTFPNSSGGGFVANCVIAWVLRGVDPTIFDGTRTYANGSGTTAPDGASMTSLSDGSWIFVVAQKATNDSTPGTVAGWTLVEYDTRSNSVSSSVGGYRLEDQAPGAYDPPAWSTWTGSGSWQTITFAVKRA